MSFVLHPRYLYPQEIQLPGRALVGPRDIIGQAYSNTSQVRVPVITYASSDTPEISNISVLEDDHDIFRISSVFETARLAFLFPFVQKALR